MKPTAIKAVRLFRAVSPLSRPIADSTHEIGEIAFLVTRVELVSGETGEAYLLCFHYSPQGILGALKDAGRLAVGLGAEETGRLIQEHERESEYFGHAGLQRWALGSLNVAMWDAWARTLGQPVWKLLGVHRRRVPVYGSGGWLSYSIGDLIEEAAAHVKRGFRAVKIKVGSPDLERDVDRLARVREAVGPEVGLMMDANQGMTVATATRLAEAVRHLRIDWLEEPLPHTDFDGYARLRRQAGLPLAMGEREYDTMGLRELVRRKAIDLWQPDILRLGGVEAWRASAALAQAHHLPVLPHFYKEYDVPLLMTIPNAHATEWFDWVDGLITSPLHVKDGYAHPGEGPGWGFRFKDERLTEIGA
ncbi:MAG TPA: mandelate racemase/muconate lactonizing enzyme family protein [Vicinamibacteria bacterium]|nr:mandelate racemase/muconate lactonizing enzyme family protein [Vicinamibacteria bacterium]